jgi:hypothetical protein
MYSLAKLVVTNSQTTKGTYDNVAPSSLCLNHSIVHVTYSKQPTSTTVTYNDINKGANLHVDCASSDVGMLDQDDGTSRFPTGQGAETYMPLN